jgi:hypothetical protein
MWPLVFVLLFYNGSEEEGRTNFFDLSKFVISFDAHISKTFSLIEHIADLSKELPYEELNAPQVASDSLVIDPLPF